MVQLAAEGRRQIRSGADETHGDEDEVRVQSLLGAGQLAHLRPSAGRMDPFDLHGLDGLELALRVADQAAGIDAIESRVGAP